MSVVSGNLSFVFRAALILSFSIFDCISRMLFILQREEYVEGMRSIVGGLYALAKISEIEGCDVILGNAL